MPSETPISSSFELLSHPDRTLARHLRGCNEVSALALQFKHISEAFFSKVLLEEMRHLLVFFHDFGKATDFFQYKIIDAVRQEGTADFQNAHQAYIADFAATKAAAIGQLLYQHPRLGDHAKLGAYFVLTVFQHDDPLVAVILLKVIRRHHGHLTNFDGKGKEKRPQILLEEDKDIPELEQQLTHFNTNEYTVLLTDNELTVDLYHWSRIKAIYTDPLEISDLKTTLRKANDLRYFFLQHFLFSLLLAADKGDMMLELETDKHERIKENRLLPTSLVELYKAKLFTGKQPGGIDHLREEAYQRILANVKQHGHQSFFSLTLPTGLGKTFAAYRVAIDLQHQVRLATDKTPRIIYCLPFTSIIDQNAQILTDMIDHYISEGGGDIDQSWLATHHYLSAYNDRYDGEELLKDEAEYLTAGWEQEVIVTTFVQLLESIFTNRNKALRKFHNLTNAVLILDEVQSIPAKYFEAVEVVFRKLAEYFCTKFVFVTATQPFLFKNPDDITELTDPRPLSERTQTRYYFDQLTRIQLDQTALKASQYEPLAIEEWITVFLEDITDQPDKSLLIINNTIAQARQVFRTLQKSDIPDTEFVYLSSSLLPIKRREKIDQIKANLAARSRIDTTAKRLVVVSTQVVEAGVDIDLDVVYRDFAPIDSLNQSAGRCNRNGNNGLGVVKLFHAGKAQYVYDPVLRDITAQVLGTYPPVIEEKCLYQLNLDYAAAVQKAIAAGSDASKTLIDAMKGLNLEDVANNFKLIEDNRDAYNVFIEFCPEARQVWQEYITLVKKLDGFELKREVKKLMPRLLQYVTRFPKNNKKNPYFPPPAKADRFIINDPNWKEYYDLETGYKLTEDDNTAVL